MFAYCGNNPAIHSDTSGFGYQLAIYMYFMAVNGNSQSYTFTEKDKIGQRMAELFPASDSFQNLLSENVPNNPWGIEVICFEGTLFPYNGSTEADEELSLSVGKATITFTCTCKDFETFTEYQVTYTVNDIYNFERWTEEDHPNLHVRLINNLGGYFPQEGGYLNSYSWTYSGTYTYRRNKSNQPAFGGCGSRKMVIA